MQIYIISIAQTNKNMLKEAVKMKRTIAGFKEDFMDDMINGNGNGTCGAILGTGMGAAVISAIVSGIIMYNNPYCWLALNFKNFAIGFIAADAAICTGGVVATKCISANMQKKQEKVESYEDFVSMIHTRDDSSVPLLKTDVINNREVITV